MKENLVGVIVDAGHGGIDSGAVGNNLLEKDLTLEASKYMYDRLIELGIPAKMTRTTDEYLPKTDRIKRVLELYNNSPNTILIANHINAGGAEGAEIVYSLKNDSTLADLALNNIGEEGQIKRKTYQRRLPENPNKDYYYILRETGNTEPILVEYGFIDNVKDANKLRNNLKNYAEGVVKAIAEYTGYPYRKRGEIPMENLSNYVVKRGDTLYSISKKTGIPVDTIKRINNLTNNNLYIGQVLNLEKIEEAEEFYIVEKGDTLYSISKKFNIPIEELKEKNNLSSNSLTIGQVLKLTDTPLPETEMITYIVEKGDTLYSIAFNNNITLEELKRINNLTSNNLIIGQQLLIPNYQENIDDEIPNSINTEDYTIYTVKKGDSLFKIAKNNNITVPDLLKLNNLSDSTLQINQQLLIPKEREAIDGVYIVKKGDTLWSVAKENNIDVKTLKEINNLDSNLLTVGQSLIIK